MEQVSTRESLVTPGIIALILAVVASVLFSISDAVGPLNSSTESLFMVTAIAGWAALGWAMLATGGNLVALAVRAFRKKSVSRLEVGLLLVCIAIIVVEVALHPLWGSGAASA